MINESPWLRRTASSFVKSRTFFEVAHVPTVPAKEGESKNEMAKITGNTILERKGHANQYEEMRSEEGDGEWTAPTRKQEPHT